MALIETIQLSKLFYRGSETIQALNSISLKIEIGEFVSIIGPSGSGKSTLMYILGLLDRQTGGSYLLDGKLTESLNDNERSQLRNQKIGFVFQTFHLLPRATAVRNVTMPLIYSASYDSAVVGEKAESLAAEALEKVGLKDRMHHKPSELSGGQRQRVAIARALVNKPQLLFADEPTGNLDSRSGSEILTLFEELNNLGVTIIMVTHDPVIARRARRIVSILDGNISRDEYVTT